MILMRQIIILLLLLITISSYGQKCKFDYNEKDAFSGEEKVGITATISKSWKLGFNRTGSKYSLGLLINFAGAKEDVIQVGDTLMLAVEGAKPLIFLAMNESKPLSNVVGSGAYAQIQTFYRLFYKADEEQMKILTKNKVTATRVYFGNLHYTVEVKEKRSKKIRKAANCILL